MDSMLMNDVPRLVDEVAGVELGDRRLTKRLSMIVEQLSSQPNLSIPAATQVRSEMEAAYRFFANDSVTPELILSTHHQNTRQRISKERDCLLVQDTTEIILTRPQQQVKGAGFMNSEVQFGALLHPLMAFTANGLPLGIVWQKNWVRSEIKTEMTFAEKTKLLKQTPIEEKESICWIEGLRESIKVANDCPETRCIVMGDSATDIYEFFSEPRETDHGRPVEILIRGCYERATTQTGLSILDHARSSPCRYTATINVSSRTPMKKTETRKRLKDRPARIAAVEVRACSVTLRSPWRPDRKLPNVPVNIVLVEEVGTPKDQDPIQWVLVTSLPVETDEQVRMIVDYYCQRWGIEIYFKTLKSGCRIEERHFEFLDREMNCIAVYMLVAWRILLLTRLGRTCPDLDCEVAFEPSEWKAVYQVVNRKVPPQTPPTLNEMIRMISSLGGYVKRTATEPGTQTLWFGLQRMNDFANCYDTFGPGAQKN